MKGVENDREDVDYGVENEVENTPGGGLFKVSCRINYRAKISLEPFNYQADDQDHVKDSQYEPCQAVVQHAKREFFFH